jgi:hypothetical protein
MNFLYLFAVAASIFSLFAAAQAPIAPDGTEILAPDGIDTAANKPRCAPPRLYNRADKLIHKCIIGQASGCRGYGNVCSKDYCNAVSGCED